MGCMFRLPILSLKILVLEHRMLQLFMLKVEAMANQMLTTLILRKTQFIQDPIHYAEPFITMKGAKVGKTCVNR